MLLLMILLLKKAEYDQNVDYRLNRKSYIYPYHAHRPLSELHLEFVCCEAYLNILDHLEREMFFLSDLLNTELTLAAKRPKTNRMQQ